MGCYIINLKHHRALNVCRVRVTLQLVVVSYSSVYQEDEGFSGTTSVIMDGHSLSFISVMTSCSQLAVVLVPCLVPANTK